MPTALPIARRPTIKAPITAKATSTPSVYQSAWLRARCGLSPLCARLSTFSDRIGSTHGIRFNTKPPAKANNSTQTNERSGFGVVAGGRVRSALSPCASAANSLPEATSPAVADAASVLGTVGSRRSGAPLAASRGAPTAPGSGLITSLRGGVWSALALTLPAGIDSFTRRVIGG